MVHGWEEKIEKERLTQLQATIASVREQVPAATQSVGLAIITGDDEWICRSSTPFRVINLRR
jgi:hypothetical protein